MFYQLKEYLKFLFKSSNHHGVHSPFVFDLLTKGVYIKNDNNILNQYLKVKKYLKSNRDYIEVTDFGAGSKIFKSNKRQISKISKVAGISNKKAKTLLKFVSYFKPNTILEIGTSLGLGTSAMHIAHPKSKITTLEGCLNTAAVAKTTFKKFKFENINTVVGDFKNTLISVTNDKKYDFVYFDGNHTKQATLNYFESCLKSIHNDSIFIFDDIYWTKEMQEAWKIIKSHHKVTVTIDIFFWGIVFFRKEQAKEHFTIRV